MSIANDERIISLKKKIEEKKANLKGMRTRAIPRTSCLITLDGVSTTFISPASLLSCLR